MNDTYNTVIIEYIIVLRQNYSNILLIFYKHSKPIKCLNNDYYWQVCKKQFLPKSTEFSHCGLFIHILTDNHFFRVILNLSKTIPKYTRCSIHMYSSIVMKHL